MTRCIAILKRLLAPLLLAAMLSGALLLALGGAPASVQAQEPGRAVPLDRQGRPLYVADEVLVVYKEGLQVQSLGGRTRSLVAESRPFGGQPRRARQRVHRLAGGASVDDAVRELAADPAVESVSPNFYLYPALVPNDTLWSRMWGFFNTGQTVTGTYTPNNGAAGNDDKDVDAELAWDVTVAGPVGVSGLNVVIAVIDTGVFFGNPDLSPNKWDGLLDNASAAATCPGGGASAINGGCDFAGTGDNNPIPTNANCWHGSHVAGTAAAAAQDGTGVPGIAYRAQIMALKVFSEVDNCDGALLDDIIEAIDYAVANDAHIINMSLGLQAPLAQLGALTASVRAAVTGGVLIVAAAGNSGLSNDVYSFYPANYTADGTAGPGVISVMATDQADVRAGFSNYGQTNVSIGAPGVNIWSVYSNSQWAASNGTSMASPLVAGIAALAREKFRDENAGTPPTPAQLKTRVLDGGDAVGTMTGCNATTKRANALGAVSGTSNTELPQDSSCPGSGTSPPPPGDDGGLPVSGGGSSSGCLITWLGEGHLSDGALEPLRRVRDVLWAQGDWGRALVRTYYRASRRIIAWLEERPTLAGTAAASPALTMA